MEARMGHVGQEGRMLMNLEGPTWVNDMIPWAHYKLLRWRRRAQMKRLDATG